MIVYQIQSFDHRVLNAADDAAECVYFAGSRDDALAFARAETRAALADVPEDDDHQFPAIQPDNPDEPIEFRIDRWETAELTPRQLVLACLNREGWAGNRTTEIVHVDRHGRVLYNSREKVAER